MTQIIGKDGAAVEVKLDLDDVREAYDAGLTVPQYINKKYSTDESKFGTAFEQCLASTGMYLSSDREFGIKPPSMRDVVSGKVDIGMGTIVRPDGSQALTVSGRLLFAATIIEMIESQLMDDNTAYEGVFNRMIGMTTSVDTPRFDQPIIDLTAPRGSISQPIGQLAQPSAMVTIKLSDKSYRVPTYSIGLEISDEAQKAATIDLVGFALREQAIGERVFRIDEGLTGMILGDADKGISALSSVNASTFDSTATSAANFSQKAWVKYLRQDWKKLAIDWIICDIDGYLAVESRVNKPIWTGNIGTDGRLNTLQTAANPGIPDNINFFIVDPVVLGSANNSTASNRLVGIDSRRAIRKVVYAGASYSAFEQYVMTKSSALRIDFSESYFRIIDGAWKSLVLA